VCECVSVSIHAVQISQLSRRAAPSCKVQRGFVNSVIYNNQTVLFHSFEASSICALMLNSNLDQAVHFHSSMTNIAGNGKW